jgi:hypothetical protein
MAAMTSRENQELTLNGILSRAAIFNPRRIKSIVLPALPSIENSAKRG